MDTKHNHSLPTKKVKWDEEVIQEHDKERGTRTKIDEPKTPFRYASESEGEIDENHGICGNHLNDHLMKEIKKQEFKDKRKKHYDEFIRIKHPKQHRNTPRIQVKQKIQYQTRDLDICKSSSEADSEISSCDKTGSSSKRSPVVHFRCDVPDKYSLKHSSESIN